VLFHTIKNLAEWQTALPTADGLELRIDCLAAIEVEVILELISKSAIPTLFTVRRQSCEGAFCGSENERLLLIEKMMVFKPTFFELEYDVDPSFLQKITDLYPQVKIIISYYNLIETPALLSEILAAMPDAYAYKMQTAAHSSLDALRMAIFVRTQTQLGKKIIGYCTGESGKITKILGPICGNIWDYAPTSALQLQELLEVYHYKKLNTSTLIYGLIGDPITYSLGHFVHNKVMQAFRLNAVYIKIRILPEEVDAFVSLAKQLGIQGLSVTMPLKDDILPYLNAIDPTAQEMKAINTIVVKEESWVGFNTDGAGALDALEKVISVQGKKIVIIGAGGAARAIAYTAHQRGAKLIILNRSIAKAEELAKEVQGEGYGLEKMAEVYQAGYHVLVNCTPHSSPIHSDYILPTAVIMDISTFSDHLIEQAKQKGATVIAGREMFINQAVIQVQLWFKDKIIPKRVLEIMKAEVDNLLN
jgi:3-dehydroquinate dehydratase/shikimate dehydrogenase